MQLCQTCGSHRSNEADVAQLVRQKLLSGGQNGTSHQGTLDQSIKEVRDQIIEFNRAGRAVKVDGLGTFSPSIDLEGNLSISFRPDPAFANGLNVPGIFTGTVINRENIGKTSEELMTKWNEAYPEDPVVFSQN